MYVIPNTLTVRYKGLIVVDISNDCLNLPNEILKKDLIFYKQNLKF